MNLPVASESGSEAREGLCSEPWASPHTSGNFLEVPESGFLSLWRASVQADGEICRGQGPAVYTNVYVHNSLHPQKQAPQYFRKERSVLPVPLFWRYSFPDLMVGRESLCNGPQSLGSFRSLGFRKATVSASQSQRAFFLATVQSTRHSSGPRRLRSVFHPASVRPGRNRDPRCRFVPLVELIQAEELLQE